jgi:hypothetical protein
MNTLEVIILAVILGLALSYATNRAKAWFNTRIDSRVDQKFQLAVKFFDQRYKREFRSFCDRAKADLHQSIENMLAKHTVLTHNSDAPIAPQSEPPDSKEPPFWKNREKLTAARAAFEQGEFNAESPDLTSMTPLEAQRQIDAALAELETDEDP